MKVIKSPIGRMKIYPYENPFKEETDKQCIDRVTKHAKEAKKRVVIVWSEKEGLRYRFESI